MDRMGVPESMTLEAIQLLLDSGKAVWGFLSSLECLPVLALVCAGALITFILVCHRRFQTKSVSINLPFKLGSITFDTTQADRVVAWKSYIQLVTRKAALPFDEKNDVIEEVYASLYSMFDTTRDLLLNLPPKTFQRPDGIPALLLRVLNDGLRPHLTRWQSDFKAWIENARNKDEYMNMSPVELQQKYPRYSDLVEDLKLTNTELSRLADELCLIARGESPGKLDQPKIRPEPPQINQNG